MMKRIIAVLTALMMLISAAALAEGSAEGTAADADAQEPASAKEKEGRA